MKCAERIEAEISVLSHQMRMIGCLDPEGEGRRHVGPVRHTKERRREGQRTGGEENRLPTRGPDRRSAETGRSRDGGRCQGAKAERGETCGRLKDLSARRCSDDD